MSLKVKLGTRRRFDLTVLISGCGEQAPLRRSAVIQRRLFADHTVKASLLDT
jgi:hypothetical protein